MCRGRGSALLLAVAASALAAFGAGAMPGSALAADHSLTLVRADVPGFRSAGGGAGVGRAALGGRVPSALRRISPRGAAFRAGSRRLLVGVFVTGSRARASRALGQAGRGFRRLRGVGDAARRRTRSGRRTTEATVVLRSGAAIGAVTLRLRGRGRGVRVLAARGASAYAAALAARLRRVLALTAWERTLDGIRPDGSITPQLALRAFAIAYGPLPGVKRPPGPLGVPDTGTDAIALVASVWERLTRAQQAAIERAVGARHAPGSPLQGRSAEAGGTLTEDPLLTGLAKKYADYYSARMPSPVPVMKVYKTSEDFGPEAHTVGVDAAGNWASGAPTASCVIRVAPKGMALLKNPTGAKAFEYVVAHEVFHCFQFMMYTGTRVPWLREGLADWASYRVTGYTGGTHYPDYLKTPTRPLFGRSYDAVGFWGRIEEVGGWDSLWATIPGIMAEPNQDTAYALAGGTNPGFLGTWPSAAWRMKGAGSAWNQLSPYPVSTSDVPVLGGVIIGSALLQQVWRHSLSQYLVLPDPNRPLVNVVGSEGHLRAGTYTQDFGLIFGQNADNAWFCFAGKCECPDGAVSTIPQHRPVGVDRLALALTGGPNRGRGQVVYHSLNEFCQKKQQPKPPEGPGESNGDPHLTSLDGLHFDFQAAGEFVLARSRSGDLEIQARQEPYRRSRTVTVNTQLAMRVGGRRVTVSPGASSADPPVVRVDGALRPLPAGTREALGAGSVERQANGHYVDVVWPDGSTVVVRPVGSWGVAARIALTKGRRNTVAGILGDFDGKPGNDLANRRNRRIPYHAKATSDWGFLRRFEVAEEFERKFFDDLYDDVGDAWRIEQRESLFDYGPGQSTRTFTDRSIPTRPYDPDDLSSRRRASAARVCRGRGVTRRGPLTDCIVDMAATGNAAFADDAAASQEAANIDWTPLRAGAERRDAPSLLEAADGTLHVAFRERTSPSAGRLVVAPLDAAGREGPTEVIAPNDGDVSLLAGPDSGVRALAAEIPSGRPSGVYQYARGAGGAWARLGPVTTFGASYLGRPGGVFLGDGTLISFSPMAGVSRLFRNSGSPNPGREPSAVPAGCYASSPALGRDGASGALWFAWLQWDCPQTGVFVQQVDPATGATVGPALQAPGSTWTSGGGFQRHVQLGGNERLAFTGRPGQAGVYLAYASDDGVRVRLWRVGDRDAVSIPRRSRTQAMRDVEIAAEPRGGRMWIGWSEEARLWLTRTTPAGAPEGSPRAVDPPRAAPRAPGSDIGWSIGAREGAVDVLFGVERSGNAPGSLWHGRLEG
jgi:von Willebrand factor type D domain